jgi:hypothetical protein
MPLPNENIKNFCKALNNAIATRMPSWKNLFNNVFIGHIALFNKEGIIPSTEQLLKEIELGNEITIQLISKQDLIEL